MPITVPKPMLGNVPSPASVTHTPYNPAQAAFNAQNPQQMSPTLPMPIGTILNQFTPGQINKPAAKPANPASNYYTPADPRMTQNYLQLLNQGYTVDPATGKSGKNYRGLPGGQLGLGPTGYRGTLDPVAARKAIEQFQGAGGVSQYGRGGYISPGQAQPIPPPGFWGGTSISNSPVSPAFQAPQTTNYFDPKFSVPGTMNYSSGLPKPTGSAFQHQVAWDPAWGANPWVK